MNWDYMLFGIVPYIFVAIAVVGTIWRYTTNRYTWSSLSSEFLENKVLFFGSFPWHFGIILILIAHMIILFIPSALLAWNAVPARLYILELAGLILGFLALVGLVLFIYRRLTDSRVRAQTTSWDVLVFIVLLIQVITGIANAIMYKWGSNWMAGSASPWFLSLWTLEPKVEYIANLPLVTKIHIFNASVFVLLIPFTRFVHFLAFWNPIKYLSRPYQIQRHYSRSAKTENIRQYK